jgi:hypothetical protein
MMSEREAKKRLCIKCAPNYRPDLIIDENQPACIGRECMAWRSIGRKGVCMWMLRPEFAEEAFLRELGA